MKQFHLTQKCFFSLSGGADSYKMPLVENFCDSVPLKEGVPVGVHRSQPVGHGVEWSVPICRCEKKTFLLIMKLKVLYDSTIKKIGSIY
jgi:hypothetical protein